MSGSSDGEDGSGNGTRVPYARAHRGALETTTGAGKAPRGNTPNARNAARFGVRAIL